MKSISLNRITGITVLPLRKIIPVLFLLFLLSSPVLAEDSWDLNIQFKPGILSADGDWTPALNFDVSISKTPWSQSENQKYLKNLSIHFRTRGTIAGDADLNTEPLQADAKITAPINLFQSSIDIPGDQPGEYKTVKQGSNWGRLDFSLLSGYETDQSLDNRNFTCGLEFSYVLTENQGFKTLIPSIYIGYDFVYNDHSDLEQTLGENDESRRARAFASWKIPIGQWLPEPLDALNAHIDLRYYKSQGIPGAYRDAGQDEADYQACALSYSFGSEPLWGVVNDIYVRVTNGRIPPVTNDNKTVMVGLTVWER